MMRGATLLPSHGVIEVGNEKKGVVKRTIVILRVVFPDTDGRR